MRVLFATHDNADYLASVCWDGLQELLGWENVYDAGNNADFHLEDKWKNVPLPPRSNVPANQNICSTRPGKHMGDEGNFDLLVLNSCFRAQHDWHWPWQLRERLRPGAKIAFVEGGDASNDVNNPATESIPPFHVDAVFRREIDSGIIYPYRCFHLDFAAPARWIQETLECKEPRLIDVYFAGGADSHPVRWEMLHYLFLTKRPFTFVCAQQSTQHNFTPQENFRLLRRSKIGLCPPGGIGCHPQGCASTMRLYETLACGAIPIHLMQPPRYRHPEVPGKWCAGFPYLAPLIEEMLATDNEAARRQMLAEVMKEHTTAARAKKLLEIVGA